MLRNRAAQCHGASVGARGITLRDGCRRVLCSVESTRVQQIAKSQANAKATRNRHGSPSGSGSKGESRSHPDHGSRQPSREELQPLAGAVPSHVVLLIDRFFIGNGQKRSIAWS
jgi:hypothetical protein